MCQRKANEPHQFRVSLPYNDCVFDPVVSLDQMNLNSRTVLHIVDQDTKLGAACFFLQRAQKLFGRYLWASGCLDIFIILN